MKRITLLLLAITPWLLTSQSQKQLTLAPGQNIQFGPSAIGKVKTPTTGLENAASLNESVPAAPRVLAELIAGVTTYDLQSNGSMARRLHNWGNGEVSATWAMSRTGSEAAGYADRGTGYNKTSGGAFGPYPTTRIEGPSTRTGFPAYFVTDAGEEWVFSHGGTVGNYTIHYEHKAASATTWTGGNVPVTTPHGGLWIRACAGGADGNSIHLIYYTTPTGASFGGVPIEGIDGMVKYCRSTDGGQTWDILDYTLPGISSDDYASMSADAYSIDASGISEVDLTRVELKGPTRTRDLAKINQGVAAPPKPGKLR